MHNKNNNSVNFALFMAFHYFCKKQIMQQKGHIRVYTGNGQGKTTAAFGVDLRAACAGKKVYIAQFVKDMKYNETKVAKFMPNITIEQLGKGCFLDREPDEADKVMALRALAKCNEIMKRGLYDLVVLDELTIALHVGLLTTAEVLKALSQRDGHTEIIITGRYAPQELIDLADLVTEMQEIKHYYATSGVVSRDGFDH